MTTTGGLSRAKQCFSPLLGIYIVKATRKRQWWSECVPAGMKPTELLRVEGGRDDSSSLSLSFVGYLWTGRGGGSFFGIRPHHKTIDEGLSELAPSSLRHLLATSTSPLLPSNSSSLLPELDEQWEHNERGTRIGDKRRKRWMHPSRIRTRRWWTGEGWGIVVPFSPQPSTASLEFKHTRFADFTRGRGKFPFPKPRTAPPQQASSLRALIFPRNLDRCAARCATLARTWKKSGGEGTLPFYVFEFFSNYFSRKFEKIKITAWQSDKLSMYGNFWLDLY